MTMYFFVAFLLAQRFSQTVLGDSVLPGNIRSVLNTPVEDSDNDEQTADLQTSDTQIASIILPHGPGGTHHVILPPSYAKVSEQSNARYSDDGGYNSQTFVISGNNFSPIEDEFHRTIPPPLHATTYGPPQPVLFSNFRKQQFYNHRFGPARSNGQYKFGFQAKEIFKPANHGLTEPVKYNPQVNQAPQGKTGPQLFHSEESFTEDYAPNTGYSPAYTYGLPEEDSQREHEIPSVRVNVDHSSKSAKPFPGNRFYQDSFFDIKPKKASGSFKHSDEEAESEENDTSEDTESKYDDDVGNYVKYAPRQHNYIPPSYSVIKPYLLPAKGITKSYVSPGFVRGHYVQKFDQSYLEPNPPHPHLQPYYKRPLPIRHTQLPTKHNYDEYSDNGYPYEPEHFGPYPEEKSASIKNHFRTSSSDWTPINAPDGAVPAKSYDIPAPDLSNGHPDKIFRRETEDHSIVVGETKQLGKIKQKIHGNSEGVVSAVVRVKQ